MSDEKPDMPNLSESDRLKINSGIVEDQFYTPDHYYLDLSLVKDFKFAALLTLIAELPREEGVRVHGALMKGIKRYQLRSFDTITNFVHKCPFTEEQVEDRLHDPKFSGQILRLAPVTAFINTISAHLIINANHSAVSENYTKVPLDEKRFIRKFRHITFHINLYPLVLDKPGRDYVALFFLDNYGVMVELLYIEPNTFPFDLFQKCDEFMVKSLWDFMESPDIQKKTECLVSIKKSVITPAIFPTKLRHKFPSNTHTRECRTLKAYLDFFFTLIWLEPKRFALDQSLLNDDKPGGANG